MGLFAAAFPIVASVAGKLLSRDKREKPQSYGGAGPYSSLKDIEEGKLYSDELKRRLQGLGVGFNEDVLNAATNPMAEKARYALRTQTIPAISADASARGLGRSSIATNRVASETAGVERDIADRIAQLQLENEKQKRNEINTALSQMGDFTLNEANQFGKNVAFKYADWNRVQGERQDMWDREAADKAGWVDLASEIIGGAYGVSGGSLSDIIKKGSSSTLKEIFARLGIGGQSTGARVPISSTTL